MRMVSISVLLGKREKLYAKRVLKAMKCAAAYSCFLEAQVKGSPESLFKALP